MDIFTDSHHVLYAKLACRVPRLFISQVDFSRRTAYNVCWQVKLWPWPKTELHGEPCGLYSKRHDSDNWIACSKSV